MSLEELGDFLAMARQECRLTLARYLFDPKEVARRIRAEVRTSRGLAEPFDDEVSSQESERRLRELPGFERAVARELLDGSAIHWVADATGSLLNGLVEYPLETVALAIKPPGSDVEFEIKRAGRRGAQPLSVVHEREGNRVPPSHRLDGGSMSKSLRSEASASAMLNAVFRLAHRTRAPVSQAVALRGIHEVPCAGGASQILNYFTEETVFGDGFGAMRAAMKRATDSFAREFEEESLKLPGPLGKTLAFLAQVGPSQALLVGSSAFRLETLHRYLSNEGPERYFTRGLGVAYTPADARRFAESLLDEVLGVWMPTDAPYRGHDVFLDDVLSLPENRRRADEVFLSLCDQIGRFWGTTYGMKWYSHGESFVGRNVGLRAEWESGRWQVRVIFMDHDGFTTETDNFSPGGAIRGCRRDANQIFGRPVGSCTGELDFLAGIYRINAPMRERGRAAIRRASSAAFRRTREVLASPAPPWSLFRPSYLRSILAWDEAAAVYLQARRNGQDREPSLGIAAEHFNRLGYAETLTTPWVEAIRQYADFLERFPDVIGVAEPSPPAVLGGRRPRSPLGPDVDSDEVSSAVAGKSLSAVEHVSIVDEQGLSRPEADLDHGPAL
jgi:hypothetical protein